MSGILPCLGKSRAADELHREAQFLDKQFGHGADAVLSAYG
jgi:hypothetical protein